METQFSIFGPISTYFETHDNANSSYDPAQHSLGPSLLAGQSLGVQSQESSAAVLAHFLECLCAQTTCIREHKSVAKAPDLFLLAIC